MTPEEADLAFVTTLERLGMSADVNGTREQTIELARQACADADAGADGTTVVGRMIASLPNVSPLQAAQFVGAAVNAYCPQHDSDFRKQLGGG